MHNIDEKLKHQIKELKTSIEEEGIQSGNNLEYLYKLVDIEKDLCEIAKESDEMRYGNYGMYGERGRSYGRRERDSRGRYTEGRRYRGHDYIDDVYENYGRYEESRDSYSRGNYGAKDDSMESLRYMLESVVDFMHMLEDEADSQEEVNMIKQYAQKIAQM